MYVRKQCVQSIFYFIIYFYANTIITYLFLSLVLVIYFKINTFEKYFFCIFYIRYSIFCFIYANKYIINHFTLNKNVKNLISFYCHRCAEEHRQNVHTMIVGFISTRRNFHCHGVDRERSRVLALKCLEFE